MILKHKRLLRKGRIALLKLLLDIRILMEEICELYVILSEFAFSAHILRILLLPLPLQYNWWQLSEKLFRM